MTVKEIRVRYGGKCDKCNREIKEGWRVYYDDEKKTMTCKHCHDNPNSAAVVPENKDARLDLPVKELIIQEMDNIKYNQAKTALLMLHIIKHLKLPPLDEKEKPEIPF